MFFASLTSTIQCMVVTLGCGKQTENTTCKAYSCKRLSQQDSKSKLTKHFLQTCKESCTFCAEAATLEDCVTTYLATSSDSAASMLFCCLLGGSSGIGRSTALAFAENGAQVAILARNEEKLREVVDLLPPERGHAIVTNLMSTEEIARGCEAAVCTLTDVLTASVQYLTTALCDQYNRSH